MSPPCRWSHECNGCEAVSIHRARCGGLSSSAMEQLGSYELLSKLGQGGMAEVFLARRVAEGVEKRLVIKRILPEFNEMPDFVAMFVREARIAATLEHPNIIQLVEFGQAGGHHFLAIEY